MENKKVKFTNGQLTKLFLVLVGLSFLGFGLQVVIEKLPTLIPFYAGLIGMYIPLAVGFILSKKPNGRWW